MRKIFKKYILIFIISILLFNSYNVFAVSVDNDYIINNYNINMVVNEDNTFDITETITAYFNVPKHGIVRKVPLKNSITRLDGTKSNNRAKISNINVNENYTTYNENGYKVIKIGDNNKTFIGSYTYTIEYTYDIGKDPLKGMDELYFNLIGNEWDTSIENISFKIIMPKEFDKSTLGFSSGNMSSNVSYNVEGNIITGNLSDTLNPGQALTVRLTLPEGYFIRANFNLDVYSKNVIIICLICILIAFFIWAKYGKDNKVIEKIEHYPPEGYNSAEIGFLYKGIADSKSVISLLIYLAHKGYIKIEETEDFKKFKIIKIKEYDGDNEYERLFFNGLFREYRKAINIEKAKEIMQEAENNHKKISYEDALDMTDSNSIKNSVTASELYNSFYTTVEKIKQKLNSKENKSKIFETCSRKKIKWLIIMTVMIFILIVTKSLLSCSNFIISLCIGVELICGLLFSCYPVYLAFKKKISMEDGLFYGGLTMDIIWIITDLIISIQESLYPTMNIIGAISIAVILLFLKMMTKRTPYGNEILGKIKGFKKFLEIVEKPKLESLVEQNPEYFYDVLPYTYALGVSDTWISKFEKIAIKAPEWYKSIDAYDENLFFKSMNSLSNAMNSNPSNNTGSSSFSGEISGGISGGGSGGGGGSSW